MARLPFVAPLIHSGKQIVFDRVISFVPCKDDLDVDAAQRQWKQDLKIPVSRARDWLFANYSEVFTERLCISVPDDEREFDSSSFSLAYLLNVLSLRFPFTALGQELASLGPIWATGALRQDVIDSIDGFESKLDALLLQARTDGRPKVLIAPQDDWNQLLASRIDASARKVAHATTAYLGNGDEEKAATLFSVPSINPTFLIGVEKDAAGLKRLVNALFVVRYQRSLGFEIKHSANEVVLAVTGMGLSVGYVVASLVMFGVTGRWTVWAQSTRPLFAGLTIRNWGLGICCTLITLLAISLIYSFRRAFRSLDLMTAFRPLRPHSQHAKKVLRPLLLAPIGALGVAIPFALLPSTIVRVTIALGMMGVVMMSSRTVFTRVMRRTTPWPSVVFARQTFIAFVAFAGTFYGGVGALLSVFLVASACMWQGPPDRPHLTALERVATHVSVLISGTLVLAVPAGLLYAATLNESSRRELPDRIAAAIDGATREGAVGLILWTIVGIVAAVGIRSAWISFRYGLRYSDQLWRVVHLRGSFWKPLSKWSL